MNEAGKKAAPFPVRSNVGLGATFIGVDPASGEDKTVARCPNCGFWHENLPNFYCGTCSDRFKKWD